MTLDHPLLDVTRDARPHSAAQAIGIALTREANPGGVGFKSLQEAIDTTTPGGRLVFHIFASLAEFERDLIRERTRAGLDAARRRGRVGGRKTVLTPAKERQARRMLAEGATKDEVAGVVGVSISTLYRRLDSGVSRVGK